jgi:hypothetical protein
MAVKRAIMRARATLLVSIFAPDVLTSTNGAVSSRQFFDALCAEI